MATNTRPAPLKSMFDDIRRQAERATKTGQTTVPLNADSNGGEQQHADTQTPLDTTQSERPIPPAPIAAVKEPTKQLNIAIRKSLHRQVKQQLFLGHDDRSFVSLVEELFEKWLREQGIEP